LASFEKDYTGKKVKKNIKKNRQCTYNVMLSRVRVTIVEEEKQ